MNNNRDIIVISDDEDESTTRDDDDIAEYIRRRPRQSTFPIPASPSRTRTNTDLSPIARRDSKRQKLRDGFSSLPVMPKVVKSEDDNRAPGPAYPRARLNFVQDEQGNTQAFPTFFDEAFYPEEVTSTPGSDAPNTKLGPAKQNPAPVRPYIDDPTFKVRMFCGPGYEVFPVPIELNEEHKKLCKEWDEKMELGHERRTLQQTRDSQFGPYVDPFIEVEVSDDDAQNSVLSPVEEGCMQMIFEVLPDVDHDFIKAKVHSRYESYRFGDEDIEVVPDTEAIVAEILELDEYPKAKIIAEREKDAFEEETGRTIQWDKSHTTHYHYTLDTVKLLAEQFDHVPTCYINKMMIEKRSLWDTYVHINELDTNYFQQTVKPYRRSKNRRTMIEKKYDRNLDPKGDPKYYASLVNELQAARQHVARKILKQAQEQQASDAERANIEKHRAQGRLSECQCCFDNEVPLNRSVPCQGICAHLFCYNCIKGLADSQVGLMKYEMLCMDSSGCKERLDTDGVAKAIPVKTFDRLAFNQQQAEIAAANIEGLEQCPFCNFKAICDPIEVDTIFSCQNPNCFRVTCRKCHEASHLPKTCEAVKKDRGLQARHKVEEARSEAMMRQCAKCKAKIIKEAGCNKMRCTCGTVLCYVCKLDLSSLRDPYEHFNKAGSKCPIYDTAGIDRHEREADDAEKKAIEEAKTLDATIEENVLQIETGKRKTTFIPPVPPVHPYHMPPPVLVNPPVDPVAQLNDLRGRIDLLREQMQNRRPRIRRPGRGRNAAAAAPQPIVVPPRAVPNPFPDPGNNLDQPPRREANFGRWPRQLPIEELNQHVHQWLQQTNPGLGGPLLAPGLNNAPANIDNHDLLEAQERDNNLRNLIAADRLHNFRNDLVQRRLSQAERRNNIRNDDLAGPPTAGFFNMRQPVPAHNADIEMRDIEPADLGFGTGIIQPINPGQAQTWRDQYRPPTPRSVRNCRQDNVTNDLADFGRRWQHDKANDQPPQLQANRASFVGLEVEEDEILTAHRPRRPTLLQQRVIPRAALDQREGYRTEEGLMYPNIEQPFNLQQPPQLQPQAAQRWSTAAVVGRAQPNTAFEQELGLLDSQWAERTQAQAQPRRADPPAYDPQLDFVNFADLDVNFMNPNNMFDNPWDNFNFGDAGLAAPVGDDHGHGLPWHRLN